MLLTAYDIQERLMIGKSTVYELLRTGRIRSKKVGGKIYRVKEEWLEEYLDSCNDDREELDPDVCD